MSAWTDTVAQYVNDTWRYVGHGSCHWCPDEDANLYILRDQKNLRAVVPPKFCLTCRQRFERGEPMIRMRGD